MIMAQFEKLMDTPEFSIMVSMILGFGLAAIFRPLCKGPDCIVLRGPLVSELRGVVYQFGSKCVEFDAKPVECPTPKPDGTNSVVETLSFVDAN
jgi:hypothetical protein